MHLFLLGVNHRSAAIDLREQLAIPLRELPEVLPSLSSSLSLPELTVLSTCNRLEFYGVTSQPQRTRSHLLDFLSHRSRLSPELLQPILYQSQDIEASRHLFRVTLGLDSMVLGESEITAQVKQTYLTAQTLGLTGPLLNRLFQKSLHCAKIVRSRTHIAEGQASIGSVVVRLVRQLFGDRLPDLQVLLWGAGKAAEATTRHLVAGGIGGLWIVNRTTTKAQDLAAMCQGQWLSWEQAMTALAQVDIAIICTQAPHYVVDDADIHSVISLRKKRPLCLIDLAVPRNVDPAIKKHPGVSVYNVDDLQTIAQGAVDKRSQELERCEALIEQQVEYLWKGWGRLALHKEVTACDSFEACVMA